MAYLAFPPTYGALRRLYDSVVPASWLGLFFDHFKNCPVKRFSRQ